MIKQALDQYAATLQRQWSHDRSQTVGASEIGQCMRKTYFVKMEGDPVYGAARNADYHDGWGAKMRGTIMENMFWAPAMKEKYGDRLMYAGEEQQSFVSGFLSATPDGMLIEQPPDALKHLGIPTLPEDEIYGYATIMAECKSADPRSNLEEAKPANVFQTHVQMGIVRETTIWRPTHSLLSYMDASFWDEVKEFVIPFDPEIYEVAKDRAAKIMTAMSANDLEPEGYLAGGKDCEHCPFTRACGVIRMSPPDDNAPADPQFVAEIEDYAREIVGLERQAETYEVEIRVKKQALKDRLREKGVKKIPGLVSWSGIKGRTTYDNKAIQAAAIEAGIDIEQFASTGDPTDRLTIQEAKSA